MSPSLEDKYIILDRDGTIIEEPSDYQIDHLSKFKFIDGVIEALINFKNQGYKFILITNQDGLGSLNYPIETYFQIENLMESVLSSAGIKFEVVLVCPHYESDNCECRKPSIKLLPEQIKLGLFDKSRSFVVGDRQSDMVLAENIQVRGLNCKTLSWSEIGKVAFKTSKWSIDRKTNETSIRSEITNFSGLNSISTGLPFFDHMLDSLIRFSGLSLTLEGKGDLDVGPHHLIEDVAICLGKLLGERVKDKKGIVRFSQYTPMDESLSKVYMDISGRGDFEFFGEFKSSLIGNIESEMFIHFFKTLALEMKINLIIELKGMNTHHQAESLFKGFGLCLKRALRSDKTRLIPSTKGVL